MTIKPLKITQLFGKNAIQTSEHLIIKKSDLLGLTATVNNRAEQLLGAILNTGSVTFSGKLQSPSGELITSPQGNVVTYKNSYDGINLFSWTPYFKAGEKVSPFILQLVELNAD